LPEKFDDFGRRFLRQQVDSEVSAFPIAFDYYNDSVKTRERRVGSHGSLHTVFTE
jgi:hypothetical protein